MNLQPREWTEILEVKVNICRVRVCFHNEVFTVDFIVYIFVGHLYI